MSRAILFPTIRVRIMGLAFKDLIQFRPLELPLSLMVQAGGLMIEATDQSNAKRAEERRSRFGFSPSTRVFVFRLCQPLPGINL